MSRTSNIGLFILAVKATGADMSIAGDPAKHRGRISKERLNFRQQFTSWLVSTAEYQFATRLLLV